MQQASPDALISLSDVVTADLKQRSYQARVKDAEILIRNNYVQKLQKVPGPAVTLVNTVDNTTPSLRFRYIDNYELTTGVYQLDPATATGCQNCSPRMGRDIGCEYTKLCECLEYAAVDETRLDDEKRRNYEQALSENGSMMGFPKKFPYFTTAARAGRLVPFYLNSRNAIYECNEGCACGPYCRNKSVQFGRKIEVEIFKTASGRGWGLRCNQALHQGQFIDTYRGEIITDEEADRREKSSSKAKGSYLYSLDKFAETEDLKHLPYVVDGEFMGGPSKFINHSCDPNCRQYTVSYNKHDPYVYQIALFACRDIAAYEELTFDYLDKEEGGEIVDPGEGAIPCLCGAPNCRKWLWT
jgi:histone-lysine N-methyltransferase SUV39H